MDTSVIFDKLDGPSAIARATGLPLTTVHSWKRHGRIPHWRVPTLIELATAKGKQDVAAALEALIPARAA